MDVIFIVESLGMGGAERVVSVLAEEFLKYYDKVGIITFIKKKNEYSINPRIQRKNIQIPGNNLGKFFWGTKGLYNCMKKNKNAIFISFDILPNILSLTANLFLKTKLIISERNAPKQANISMYSKIMRCILYPLASKIIFQTEGAKACYPQFIQKKGIVIPNPVKDNLPERDKENLNNEIVAIGRLEEQKNYILLIEAFERYIINEPNYLLLIYGDGNQKEKLENIVINKGLKEKIKFMGARKDVHYNIIHSKIFVMTSNFEGMPNALLEAMAMGFPVIATDCPSGGPASLIINKENGILVPVNDIDALVENMLCLSRENEFRERIGERAKMVKQEYSLQNITEMWLKCLSVLV